MSTATPRTAPIDRLRELFHCDYLNGIVTWRKKPRNGKGKPGSRAGTNGTGGYRVIGFDGGKMLEHRIIYAMAHGEWPPEGYEIDHANMKRDDNRLSNLRLASRSQNRANTKIRVDNKTGFKGVNYCKRDNTFVAHATKDGKLLHLGCFKTAKEAHKAYCDYVRKVYSEFARFE